MYSSSFFITFRHGSHLQLKAGDALTIDKAEQEAEEQVGINVYVAKINDTLDFVLLKSEVDVVGMKSLKISHILWNSCYCKHF